MKREQDLRRRLHSLESLGEAVTAMKSLSAHHFREVRATVEPARRYREGIDHVLASTGALLPGGHGPAGLLLLGAELGLCGGYNARLVTAAVERRAALGRGPTFCVGRRAAALLGRRAVASEHVYAAPTSVRGLTDLLLRLAQDLLTEYVARQLSVLEVVSSRFSGVGADRPTTTRLLPVEAHHAAGAPTARYVSRERLAAVAVRELLYITLYDLLIDALASEHGARLLATQSAEQWLDERMDRLRRHLAGARREASTQETIEIAAGARARREAAGPSTHGVTVAPHRDPDWKHAPA
jgi:F-type H+-transporting ATPase subunit gamma